MNIQVYTSTHDGATPSSGGAGFFEKIKHLLSDGNLCYVADHVAGNIITVNKGVNPCDYTIYKVTDGAATINNVKLKKINANTMQSSKDLSALSGQIRVFTDSSSFGWEIEESDSYFFKLKNQHGALVVNNDFSTQVEKGGALAEKAVYSYEINSGRYVFVLNENFFMAMKPNSLRAQDFLFFCFNETYCFQSGPSGSGPLDVSVLELWGLDETLNFKKEKFINVTRSNLFVERGSNMNISCWEPMTDSFVLKNVLTAKHTVDFNININEFKKDHSLYFFEDSNNTLVFFRDNLVDHASIGSKGVLLRFER